MARLRLTDEVLPLIAERFQALADPARLSLLLALKRRESTVSELVERTGMGQANVSKHLKRLHEMGFVKRDRDGTFVRYSLADRDVLKLCDVMCGRVEREMRQRIRLLA